MQNKTQVQSKTQANSLPPIPDKRYFTIGEVSHLCAVKPHVLRYWEQEFSQLKPCKRRGNRRYYQYQDVVIVRHIRYLLYDQGFTICGARSQLQGERQRKPDPQVVDQPAVSAAVSEFTLAQSDSAVASPTRDETLKHTLRETIHELEAILTLLKPEPIVTERELVES